MKWKCRRKCQRKYLTECFLSVQLHPLEGEAVQVRRLRQRILPVAHFGRPPDPSPGGIAAQVSGLFAQLQPALQPQDSPADAHRPQTVRVFVVWKGLPAELWPEAPCSDARRRWRRSWERRQRNFAPFARSERNVQTFRTIRPVSSAPLGRWTFRFFRNGSGWSERIKKRAPRLRRGHVGRFGRFLRFVHFRHFLTGAHFIRSSSTPPDGSSRCRSSSGSSRVTWRRQRGARRRVSAGRSQTDRSSPATQSDASVRIQHRRHHAPLRIRSFRRRIIERNNPAACVVLTRRIIPVSTGSVP